MIPRLWYFKSLSDDSNMQSGLRTTGQKVTILAKLSLLRDCLGLFHHMFILSEHVAHGREKHSDQHLCSFCNGILSLSLNRGRSNTRDHSLLAFERKKLELYLESLYHLNLKIQQKVPCYQHHCFAMLAKLYNSKGTVLRVKG